MSTISVMRSDRTVLVYEIYSEIEYASVVKLLREMKYVLSIDGMWVPSCDVKQRNSGRRPAQ